MTRRTVFIPYRPKTILNKHKRADHWFWTRYSAYPFIGCQHGCEFCYCRERKYAPYDDPADFAYVIKVKENAPELLRRALARAAVDPVFTGDYQPAERKFGMSRRMLEVCLEAGFPVFVLERSPLVFATRPAHRHSRTGTGDRGLQRHQHAQFTEPCPGDGDGAARPFGREAFRRSLNAATVRRPPTTDHRPPTTGHFFLGLDRQTGERLGHAGDGLDPGGHDSADAGDVRRFNDGDGVIGAERHGRLDHAFHSRQLTHDLANLTGPDLNQNVGTHGRSPFRRFIFRSCGGRRTSRRRLPGRLPR